jgi:hypothetical protein
MRGQRFHRVEDEEDEHKSAGGKKGRKGENTPESERVLDWTTFNTRPVHDPERQICRTSKESAVLIAQK